MSDSKVVVVDASSWIVEAFFFVDIFGVFGVGPNWRLLACEALF